MPDFKEMYLKMLRASEQAINILIAAQRECEELYISLSKPEFEVASILTENHENMDEE